MKNPRVGGRLKVTLHLLLRWEALTVRGWVTVGEWPVGVHLTVTKHTSGFSRIDGRSRHRPHKLVSETIVSHSLKNDSANEFGNWKTDKRLPRRLTPTFYMGFSKRKETRSNMGGVRSKSVDQKKNILYIQTIKLKLKSWSAFVFLPNVKILMIWSITNFQDVKYF